MKGRFGEVTVAMATFPPRLNYAIDVLRTLWPQCDHLKVCLNQFETVPDEFSEFVKDIESTITDEHTLTYVLANGKNGIPDLGCNNKMRWLDECNGYYLTVDDDIEYPDTYVERLVAGIDRHGGEAVCSFHGNIFLRQGDIIVPDNKHKKILMYNAATTEDTKVHLCGMGVGGCVPKMLGITFGMFSCDGKNSGDDEKMSKFCAKNNIPMFVVAKPRHFLKQVHLDGYKLSTDVTSRSERIMGLQDAGYTDLPERKLALTYITDGTRSTELELAVSIYSALLNARVPFKVNLLYTNMSTDFKLYLSFLEEKFFLQITKVQLTDEHMSKCMKYAQPTIAKGKASATAISLTKFTFARLLKDNYILFLDNDTMIFNSLRYFYDLLNRNTPELLFAVRDNWCKKVNAAEHPYHQEDDYFNSGSMFINLNAWRKQKIEDKLWKAKEECVDQLLMDQNSLNMVFHGKVNLIEEKFNATTWKVQPADTVIMHFCGKGFKPIKHPESRYCHIWYDYYADIKRFFPDIPRTERTQSNADFSVVNPIGKFGAGVSFSQADNEKHDAVFVLGDGSMYRDLELMLAVKSMRKFCPFVDRIFIVGNKPRCSLVGLNCKCIQCKDPYVGSKDSNMMFKVLHAIDNIPDLSENFLLCSDDQMVTQFCSWDDFKPKYIKRMMPADIQEMKQQSVRNSWARHLVKTLEAANETKGKVWFYEPHIWSPINKTSFKSMLKAIGGLKNAGVIKSQYYNYIDNLDHERIHDHKFFDSDSLNWSKTFKNPPKFISYNDKAFTSDEFRSQLIMLVK